MHPPEPSELVPASLIRLRCFINRRGMKVKPWLGPREVLAALHGVLGQQRDDDTFWVELGELLADLARDLRRRLERRGQVVQNELLDAGHHRELLIQIRAALEAHQQGGATLRELVARLPAAAAALVLMIGAATAVGCGGTTDSDGTAVVADDGGSEADVSVGAGGAGPDASTLIDSSVVDAGNVVDSGDGRPDTGFDATAPGTCEPELVSALVDCSSSQASAQAVVDCACLLNDSWRSGITDLFADASCEEIRNYLGCCSLDVMCRLQQETNLPDEFDVDYLMDNSCCLLYLGVRCE